MLFNQLRLGSRSGVLSPHRHTLRSRQIIRLTSPFSSSLIVSNAFPYQLHQTSFLHTTFTQKQIFPYPSTTETNRSYSSINKVLIDDTITGAEFPNHPKMATETTTQGFSRLPKTVVPSNYKLTLKPDLNKLVFEGSQEIDVHVTVESTEIVMNAADLTVSNVEWLDTASGTTIIPTDVVLNTEQETLTLKFSTPIPPGQGKVKMSFTGELNDKMKGFYRSTYKGTDGVDRFNAVTQFEATDARRCFPNWDEPAVKATFDVTLVVPKDRVALSNMPVKSTKPYEADESLHVVEYETTPIMSTYLLAFVVGEFDYIEATSEDGVLCRVYTPPGKKEQGRFALDVAARTLPYYKNYFGIPYPLPKIDLVAIADFTCGAMENWGLVTYRETALLVDAHETSASTKQWVAIVVAHELAHQWFGNLVTMEWWTHLWLNEGYASFVEFMCVDHLFPDWDMWTQFVTDTHIRALELDCLKNSHPIEVPVNHPKEIDEIFDDISYAKGAAVIRMLYNFIGDDAFRRGMNLYLTRHQYGNTFTEDLWRALGEASSKPVEEVMSTWTKQMGFPLIRVTESVQEGNQRRLTLTQEKFTADPKGEVGSQSWLVPLSFSTGVNPGKVTQEALLTDKSLTVNVTDVNADQWIKVNPRTVGFYRVLYPSEMLSEFIPAIKSKSLPPLDRLGLLDDVFALVQAGKASSADVLKLMGAYVEESDYTCWTSLSSIIGKLNLLLAYSDSHDAFKAYGRSIFGNIAETTGWDVKPNEGHLGSMLRSLILNRMVGLEHEPTLKEAKRRFALHVSGDQPIMPDLRTAVYKGTLATGDEKTFDSVMKLYMDASTQEEKDRIARAMGSMKDKNLLKKVLEFAISEHVRKQDTVFVIIAVSFSKDGRDLAWDFFKENVQKFQDYPSQHNTRAIKHITENFVTEEKALEVEQFFRDNSFPGTERTVQQAIESIRLNQAWLARDLAQIKQFLQPYTS